MLEVCVTAVAADNLTWRRVSRKFIFGPLSDRYGRKMLLVSGLFLLGLITFSIGFVRTWEQMILLRIFQGLIAATFAPVALAFISEQISPDERAKGIAWVSTGFMTAGVLGQLFASEINFYFGWHKIFLVSGIIYLGLAISIQSFLTELAFSRPIAHLSPYYKAMLLHLINPKLLVAYVCSFFLLLSFVAMYSGLDLYLRARPSFTLSHLFYIRALGLIGMLVAPFSGFLITKWGCKRILLMGLFIAASGIIAEGFFTNINMIIVSSIVFVSGIAISAPAIISYIGQKALIAKGSAIALYTFILFAGAAMGSLFANFFATHSFVILTHFLFSSLMFCLFIFYLNAK